MAAPSRPLSARGRGPSLQQLCLIGSVRRRTQDYAQYDGIVVLLQAGAPEPGAILGAARVPLRARS